MDERLVTHLRLFYDEVLSPVGTLGLAWDSDSLRALSFENPGRNLLDLLGRSVGDRHGTCAFERSESPYREPLNRYFSGELTALDALQAECTGTPFQKLVWDALRRIPCGMTWSYSQLAEAIGRPRAARAVGLANSQNPVAIVVPCHRVIGANGSLVGYGGGLARKLWLLRHEGASVEQLKAPEVTISNEHQGHLF